jgi:hypothetical protein
MATPPVFSAGAVLTAAQMNAIGLWLVKTDTITSGASKVITDCFNTDFRNYQIVISDTTLASLDTVQMRYGTTSTGYYASMYYDKFDGTNTATSRQNNGGGFMIGLAENLANNACATFTAYGPNTTKAQKGVHGTYFGGGYSGWFGGTLVSSTAFTSMTIYSAGGTLFSDCKIYVYGFND